MWEAQCLVGLFGCWETHSLYLLILLASLYKTSRKKSWSPFLWQKPVSTTQGQPLRFLVRKFPFQRQLGSYWALIETAPMTERHKRILKPEIPMTSWVMLNKSANKEGHAQRSSIIKWKWFIEEHSSKGVWGGSHRIQEQVASLPLGPTLEPPEGQPDPLATWVVPVNSSRLAKSCGNSKVNDFLWVENISDAVL